LLNLLIVLYRRAPGVAVDNPWSAMDQALASDDLQLVYDLACEAAPQTEIDPTAA
jgi:ABC-type thiamine transport system ATPase subunit